MNIEAAICAGVTRLEQQYMGCEARRTTIGIRDLSAVVPLSKARAM